MNRLARLLVFAGLIMIAASSAVNATNLSVSESWYVRILNVTEYRVCPSIGPWVMTGFFECFNGSYTPAITPTIVDDGATMDFDFHNGYVRSDQTLAWASPTWTICPDLVSHERFDWMTSAWFPWTVAFRLELWAFANDLTPDEVCVWSVSPARGISSGHAEVDFTSYDRVQYRLGFYTVPEPSGLLALIAGVGWWVRIIRKRP